MNWLASADGWRTFHGQLPQRAFKRLSVTVHDSDAQRLRGSEGPCAQKSFAHAQAPEQRVHVGPEPLPRLAFLVR
jgi:hypothetical protein